MEKCLLENHSITLTSTVLYYKVAVLWKNIHYHQLWAQVVQMFSAVLLQILSTQ